MNAANGIRHVHVGSVNAICTGLGAQKHLHMQADTLIFGATPLATLPGATTSILVGVNNTDNPPSIMYLDGALPTTSAWSIGKALALLMLLITLVIICSFLCFPCIAMHKLPYRMRLKHFTCAADMVLGSVLRWQCGSPPQQCVHWVWHGCNQCAWPQKAACTDLRFPSQYHCADRNRTRVFGEPLPCA